MTREVRPWGAFEILLDAEYTKVKRITVNPASRLSYQSHNKRREEWICVKGTLDVVLNDKDYTVYPGQAISIPWGAKHRAQNLTNEECIFIEVQTGEYFGEDDIIRYEDDYARS